MTDLINKRLQESVEYLNKVISRPKEITYEYVYNPIEVIATNFWAKRNDIRFGIPARVYYDRNNMPLAGYGRDDLNWPQLIITIQYDHHFAILKKNLKDWALQMNKKHKELCEQEHKYKLLTEAPLNNKALRKKRNLAV